MATKEDQELFRAAENWLTENPGKTLADWRKETGYTGPALKIRNRRGEPVRVSFKGQSTAAQTQRAAKEKPKTEEEAKYLQEVKRQAREQSQSTEVQYVSGGKPVIAEHDVRLASGGTSEYLSISDPEFKVFKDTVESKVYNKFGDSVVVDIDDVSGDVRVIPSRVHNKFEPTSRQPGVDIPMGSNIDEALKKVKKVVEMPLSNLLDFSGGKALLNVLPMGAVATAAFTAADIAQAAQGVSSVQQATSTPEAVAGGLEAASGALDVAATKVPVLAAPAAVFGVTGGAIRMRMERDIEREQIQQVMAGERSEYGPAVTQTPTLTRTKSNYERNIQSRMKARKRR